jgi:hypothetical protein
VSETSGRPAGCTLLLAVVRTGAVWKVAGGATVPDRVPLQSPATTLLVLDLVLLLLGVMRQEPAGLTAGVLRPNAQGNVSAISEKSSSSGPALATSLIA